MFLCKINYILEPSIGLLYKEGDMFYIYSNIARAKFIIPTKIIGLYNNNELESYISMCASYSKIDSLTLSMYHYLCLNTIFGISRRFRVIGRGYKTHARAFLLSNKLGYSHLLFNVLPVNYRISKRKRKDKLNFWKLSGIETQVLGDSIKNIQNIKIPNIYTKKGIYRWGDTILFKEGKKAYVL